MRHAKSLLVGWAVAEWTDLAAPWNDPETNEPEHIENRSPAGLRWAETVTFFSEDDLCAPFSNYGEGVDFAAPGIGIKSLWGNGGTATMSGTSAAAPHVASLILLRPATSDGQVVDHSNEIPDAIAVL